MSIILAVVVAVVGFAVGFAVARMRYRSAARAAPTPIAAPPAALADAAKVSHDDAETSAPVTPATTLSLPMPGGFDGTIAERARIIRSYEGEAARLGQVLAGRDATITHLTDLAAERRRLFDDLATARAETARYRQLVIDIENNAAPQFFGVDAPDDLKLIVGIGPVLERMLQMMGVATYRQIARWTERDIDEFDAKLHEFPGRIRRDAWVTQARALHQSKYGEAVPLRGRA